MKFILVLISLFISVPVFSYCEGVSSKVDNNSIYAEVNNNRSHLEMDLILVSKMPSYYSSKIKVFGGTGFSYKTVPDCKSSQLTDITWLNSNIATHETHRYNGWQATYRICLFNVRNELKASYTICNYNTGD